MNFEWTFTIGNLITLTSLVLTLGGLIYKINAMGQDLETLTAKVERHRSETSIHIDPERDKRAYEEMMRRFSNIETMQTRMAEKQDRIIELLLKDTK